MKDVTISHGKINTKIVEVNNTLEGITTFKHGELETFLEDVSQFAYTKVPLKKLDALKAKLAALGYSVEVDEKWGFEWECKLFCKKVS